jgi:uncharacterized protein YggE
LEGKIEVWGQAAVEAPPDEAELVFELTSLEQQPSSALAEVSRRSNALQNLLEKFNIAPGKRLTTQATVHTESEYVDRRRVHVGFRGRIRVSVRIREFDRLGPLMSAAIEQTGCSVEGPFWQVDLMNEARVRVCKLAAEEARRRADAYADALGLRVGSVLQAEEPDVSERYGQRLGGVRAFTAMADEGPAVESGELIQSASIRVVFSLDSLPK